MFQVCYDYCHDLLERRFISTVVVAEFENFDDAYTYCQFISQTKYVEYYVKEV